MSKKSYIVTALDTGDSADNVPQEIGQFNTREEAFECVKQDMREYCDNYTWVDEETGETHGPAVYDEVKMYIESSGGETSCQWTVIEADV